MLNHKIIQQMERSASFAFELKQFEGKVITKDMLRGRGYIQVEHWEVVDDNFPHLKELYWKEEEPDEGTQDYVEPSEDVEIIDDEDDDYVVDDDEEDEITCKQVKQYIAGEIFEFFEDDSQYWIKGLPAYPEDVNNQEAYMVLCIGTKPNGDNLEITKVMSVARMVQPMCGGWFSIPGKATMESHFFEMEFVPPELMKEVHALVSGRFIPNGFTLIGKPMPENKDMFYSNPSEYTIAYNSGWRNVYWHLTIEVDDDEKITDIELCTNERETSMFQRPYGMNDDTTDAFDAALMIVDQYSDEEWSIINE